MRLEGDVEHWPDAEEHITRSYIRSGEVTACISDEPLPKRRVSLHGVLSEEHHGDVPSDLPPTVGIIRRIQTVRQEFELRDRTWRPTKAEPRLEEVQRYPDGYVDMPPHEGPTAYWAYTGAIVDLTVTDD